MATIIVGLTEPPEWGSSEPARPIWRTTSADAGRTIVEFLDDAGQPTGRCYGWVQPPVNGGVPEVYVPGMVFDRHGQLQVSGAWLDPTVFDKPLFGPQGKQGRDPFERPARWARWVYLPTGIAARWNRDHTARPLRPAS